MIEPTIKKPMIIEQCGKPMYVVLPYAEWESMGGPMDPEDERVYIPHEVVGYQVKRRVSLLAAWRMHRRMTQDQLAKAMGISQAAIAQMEHKGNKLRASTIDKLAKILDADPAQLIE